MRRVALRDVPPAPVTVTWSVRAAPFERERARRTLRETRTVKVRAVEPATLAVPVPSATLRPPERMPSRRAPEPLTIRRALMVQAVEQTPATRRPRRATPAGLSSGRRAIARASETDPAAVTNVAFAPWLRPSARRTFRDMPTFTAPAPPDLRLPPRRTGRLPRRGRPSCFATRDDTLSEVVREQAPSQELSAVRRPDAASASDSSIANRAKSGGACTAPPPTVKLTGALEPLLPAASPCRATTV